MCVGNIMRYCFLYQMCLLETQMCTIIHQDSWSTAPAYMPYRTGQTII